MKSKPKEGRLSEEPSDLEIATLGGGCFWCLEAIYDQLQGVTSVTSGYAGGSVADPTYEQVCTGTTGHAEVVQISFDPGVITFRDLLHIFFTIHNPTTLDRQGGDVGPQYRSAIFYHNEEQRVAAEDVMRELGEEGVWDAPIVTEVTPFPRFFEAEAYHQEYYQRNGGQPYCRVVIAPKVAKFRKTYFERLKRS